MKKLNYFFILTLTIFILTGCSKSTVIVQNEDVKETSTNQENEIKEVVEPIKEINPIDAIDLSLNPNELGEIMILMYHGIGDEEKDWQRTPDNFRKDLQYMYENKYSMISLNDYSKGEIKTKAGYTPIILTFDDGRQNNFNVEKVNGEYIIDKNSAVGILEEFKNNHPDFNVTASFFLGTNFFGQDQYADYKLKFLIDNGYDIGNHTYSHKEIANLNSEEIQFEIGKVNALINKIVPDYTVETLALPHGSNPEDIYLKYVTDGLYENKSYKNLAVLDVGWRPSYSPYDLKIDFTSLYRVTASEINVDNCGMYDYFKQYEQGSRTKFISDGNPDVVTIKKENEKDLNKNMLRDRVLNIIE